jgi:nucleotide-binding universal stress UspA family protein
MQTMTMSIVEAERSGARANVTHPGTGTAACHIAACIDASTMARKVIAHAVAAAKALHGELTLIRVLEGHPAGQMPPDPVEWEILRREARDSVERLVRQQNGALERIKAQVIEGQAAEQICQWARDNGVDLTVFCTHGEGDTMGRNLGSTARRVIDRAAGSFLLVPHSVRDEQVVQYRRVLVPLDGSSRAESALPLAVRLAQAHQGEVVLVHVVPVPELTEIGPLETEVLELRERLICRNERVAQEYLDRVRGRVADQGIAVRSLVLRDSDVRRRLARAVVDEAADLVVLSAHGRSGHVDVPHGSIAAYQMVHSGTPLLIVRDRPTWTPRRLVSGRSSTGVRLPEQATP